MINGRCREVLTPSCSKDAKVEITLQLCQAEPQGACKHGLDCSDQFGMQMHLNFMVVGL